MGCYHTHPHRKSKGEEPGQTFNIKDDFEKVYNRFHGSMNERVREALLYVISNEENGIIAFETMDVEKKDFVVMK